MKRAWIMGGIVGALALTGAAYFWNGRAQEPVEDRGVFEEQWPVGQRATYDLGWETTALAEQLDPDSGEPRPDTLSRIQVEGRLQLTRVDAPSNRMVLRAVLFNAEVEVEMEQRRTLKQKEKLIDEVQRPFRIEFDRSGLVRRVLLPAELGTTGFSVFKSIAALIQKPARPREQEEWRGIEADLAGRAEFMYSANDTRLEKKKLEYLSLTGGSGLGAQAAQGAEVTVAHSQHVHDLGEGWFAPPSGVTVEEETRVELGGAYAPMTSRTRFSLSLLEVDDEASPAHQDDQLQAARLDQMPPEATQRRERQEQSVAGRTVAELTKTIVDLEGLHPRNRQAEARVFAALTDKMRLDAAARAEAEQKIVADEDRMLLLDALGSAGTPESQAMLVRLIEENDFGREQTRSTLINLSMSQEPTDSTVEALRERTSDPSHGRQATFGLGSAAFNLKDSHPQKAVELVRELTERLEASEDESEQAMLLKALGNTGHSLALPSCERAIADASWLVRLGAADCARLISGPRAESVLAQALRDDNDNVLQAASHAALQRTYSSILAEPLQLLALSDRQKSLRIVATQTLAKWVKTEPTLRATVQQVAETAPEEDLREYAARELRKAS